jgi:hypothetical protein
MKPSVYALVDELAKIAEEQAAPTKEEPEKPRAWRFPSAAQWKEVGKSMAIYGAGMGLGSAGGYALRKKVLPKLYPNISDKALTALSMGGGALIGLGGGAAFKQMMRKADDARKHEG